MADLAPAQPLPSLPRRRVRPGPRGRTSCNSGASVNPWHALLDVIEGVLRFFHTAMEPLFGLHAWGWAIILLTVAVRVVLLPLAIKQTRSQRAMQTLQPEMKKIQAKY